MCDTYLLPNGKYINPWDASGKTWVVCDNNKGSSTRWVLPGEIFACDSDFQYYNPAAGACQDAGKPFCTIKGELLQKRNQAAQSQIDTCHLSIPSYQCALHFATSTAECCAAGGALSSSAAASTPSAAAAAYLPAAAATAFSPFDFSFHSFHSSGNATRPLLGAEGCWIGHLKCIGQKCCTTAFCCWSVCIIVTLVVLLLWCCRGRWGLRDLFHSILCM